MDLETTFPLRFLLNLGRRDDRRALCEREFYRHRLAVERFPAIDHRWVKSPRGFFSTRYYACALTHRLAVRQARLRGAEAVLIFEDDVILHPELRERLAAIELPDDWGLFFLGCSHTARPEIVAPNLVKARAVLDCHAYAVRSGCYDAVIAALASAPDAPAGSLEANDRLVSRLLSSIPSYAVFPNLAWQAPTQSEITDSLHSLYSDDGSQTHTLGAINGLEAELLGGRSYFSGSSTGPSSTSSSFRRGLAGRQPSAPRSIRPAFLLLAYDRLELEEVWREYFDSCHGDCSVHAHVKNPNNVQGALLRDHQIPIHFETAWGDISLVRATLGLLRTALDDRRNTHFVLLSGSCAPIKPFETLRSYLALDPRSHLRFRHMDEVAEENPVKARRFECTPSIPSRHAYLQDQWMVLNREAAELVVEDDFTAEFEKMFAPDEAYFITTLALKGYPVVTRVNNTSLTFTRWLSNGGHPMTFRTMTAQRAAQFMISPCHFARKFSSRSNLGLYRLHLASTPIRNVTPIDAQAHG